MQNLLHILNGMVKGFSKMYNLLFFGQFFFCKHFYYKTGFCKKKFNFCKFAIFFADSKRRAQELSNDVLFVIFEHQTWDLEGGGSNWPPPSISWFSSTPAEIGLKVLKLKNMYSDFLVKLDVVLTSLLCTQNLSVIHIKILKWINKCRFPNKDLQNRTQESLTCINGILVLLFKKLDYFYEWAELSDHSF